MDILRYSTFLENEDLLLLNFYSKGRKRLKVERQQLKTFDLTNYDDKLCDFNFRFTQVQLRRLNTALGLPNKMKCKNGTSFSGMEGLCILLRRLAYPNRLGDLSPFFSRSKSELSMIISTMISFILSRFGHLLTTLNRYWLKEEYLAMYASIFHRNGAPLNMCWGMIDGTIRGICRPKKHQKIVYNGHKRKHSLKFQSVVTPNGLIANLFGPIEGRRHDCFLLSESNILQESENMKNTNGQNYYMYGDPAYPLRPQLQGPYKGAVVTADQAAFNKALSAVRICVEWEFGKISKIFAFLDFKKNLKLYLQPIGKYYQIGALLSNCHTCLNGSQTSQHFVINPPDLENYLSDLEP